MKLDHVEMAARFEESEENKMVRKLNEEELEERQLGHLQKFTDRYSTLRQKHDAEGVKLDELKGKIHDLLKGVNRTDWVAKDGGKVSLISSVKKGFDEHRLMKFLRGELGGQFMLANVFLVIPEDQTEKLQAVLQEAGLLTIARDVQMTPAIDYEGMESAMYDGDLSPKLIAPFRTSKPSSYIKYTGPKKAKKTDA